MDLQQYKEKLIQELNSINENLVKEYLEKKKTDVGDYINTFISKERSTLKKDFSKNIEDLKNLLEKTVSEFNERTPSLDEKIKLVQEKLDQLPKEGQMLIEAKDDIISLSKKYTDSQLKLVSEDTKSYAKRILDLGGGGGSVATQYANGGTMNGNLNVNGNILSGGVNLLNVFSGGGGLTDRLVNGSSQAILSSDGNLIFPTGSKISRGYPGLPQDDSSWFVAPTGQFGGLVSADGEQYIQLGDNSPIYIGTGWPDSAHEWTFGTDGTTLFPNQAIDGGTAPIELKSRSWSQLTYNNIDMTPAPNKNHSTTFFVEGGDALLEIFRWDNSSVLQHRQWTFSSDGSLTFPDNTTQTTAFTGNPDSSNWDSTYTTVKNTSANWNNTYTQYSSNSASYATIGFVNGKFLPVSGGSITGNLVVQGSLTALGNATFANTIFTTTSALSVINTGPGPALYVFQSAGPYDVASFYDGDGVEVLHVGNANPGGNGFVGINESFPTVELSVRGAISASKTITALGGNSNQWNNAYTNLVYNSTAYLSGFNSTAITQNSASWNNAYTNLVYNSTAYLSAYDMSLVNSNSANWSSVYTSFNSNSANYNSVYLTVSALSASWEESAEILPTVINYLSTNNVTISALTVTKNLSVGGTIYSSATALVIAEYETLIGNGVNTSFTVNHNLNTDNIQVVVYDVGNNIASYPSIQILNNNSVSIGFSFAPPLNYYRVLVFGTVPSNQINAYGQIYTVYTTATGLGNIPTLSGNWNSTYQTVCALSAFWSQGGTSSSYTVTAQNFNITGASNWAVNTQSNTVTGTLPSSPTSGMTINFLDANKTWATNNLVLQRNGQTIESLAENLNCDISGFSFSLTYVGGSIGWRVY